MVPGENVRETTAALLGLSVGIVAVGIAVGPVVVPFVVEHIVAGLEVGIDFPGDLGLRRVAPVRIHRYQRGITGIALRREPLAAVEIAFFPLIAGIGEKRHLVARAEIRV